MGQKNVQPWPTFEMFSYFPNCCHNIWFQKELRSCSVESLDVQKICWIWHDITLLAWYFELLQQREKTIFLKGLLHCLNKNMNLMNNKWSTLLEISCIFRRATSAVLGIIRNGPSQMLVLLRMPQVCSHKCLGVRFFLHKKINEFAPKYKFLNSEFGKSLHDQN